MFLYEVTPNLTKRFKITLQKNQNFSVNPNNRNETKPDISSWDKFKSDIIFH